MPKPLKWGASLKIIHSAGFSIQKYPSIGKKQHNSETSTDVPFQVLGYDFSTRGGGKKWMLLLWMGRSWDFSVESDTDLEQCSKPWLVDDYLIQEQGIKSYKPTRIKWSYGGVLNTAHMIFKWNNPKPSKSWMMMKPWHTREGPLVIWGSHCWNENTSLAFFMRIPSIKHGWEISYVHGGLGA